MSVAKSLYHRVNYRRSIGSALQNLLHRFPDEIYIIGIEAVTLITVVALITSLFRAQGSLGVIFGASAYWFCRPPAPRWN